MRRNDPAATHLSNDPEVLQQVEAKKSMQRDVEVSGLNGVRISQCSGSLNGVRVGNTTTAVTLGNHSNACRMVDGFTASQPLFVLYLNDVAMCNCNYTQERKISQAKIAKAY